ncbi:ATP-binding protein [Paenibacillus sp. GCM10023252]|uniref:ATP-binding protein n=1 Tax=Paenibacillus sp. GCM10023252 TaxID=3252649 RepID=UPI003620D84B
MSFKTKLPLVISIIVFSMLILHIILNEYLMTRNMQNFIKQMARNTALQMETLFRDYEAWDESYLHGDLSKAEAIGIKDGKAYILDMMKAIHPSILEVTAYRVSDNGQAIGGPAEITVAIGYGQYKDEAYDEQMIRDAYAGELVVHNYRKDNLAYTKSYYRVGKDEPYVLVMVFNHKNMYELIHIQRNNQILIGLVVLLLVVLFSYWTARRMIRPIQDILWKVNEVSFGRFQTAIKVNRRDEFGLLALRVNGMSQNLSIYMDKLRRAFDENRTMKEYLESFINHTSDAIHVFDLDLRITQVNRAFEHLYGYQEEEAVGHILELSPEPYKEEAAQTIQYVLAGRILPAQETIRMTKSGDWISVSVTTSPIRDQFGTICAFACITRDMTSRNKMEELLRRSEKLTTVGQLAAGVAHEIRNPLTTLRGFLQLQQENQKHNPSHNTIMLSELDRINLIVSEFLILAKPQATKFEVKDVRFVFGDVISLLDSEAHLHNVVFHTQFPNDPCRISCVENQLKQVFINLIKNAIEAMPGGGRIYVKIARQEHDILISIVDEGIGISEEMITRIGDPFFTGKESGTGLGIMVSQRIIQSHRGMMDIKSQVDVGTTVTITLPALRE